MFEMKLIHSILKKYIDKDILYVAREKEELDDFLDNAVIRKLDSLYGMRKLGCNNFIKHFDGKNGCRIKQFIKEKFFYLIQDKEKMSKEHIK